MAQHATEATTCAPGRETDERQAFVWPKFQSLVGPGTVRVSKILWLRRERQLSLLREKLQREATNPRCERQRRSPISRE